MVSRRRVVGLLPALAAVLAAGIALAQAPPAPEPATAGATLFFPRTVARAEERGYDGEATWRMIDLGPTTALEAVVTFAGIDADMIVLVEENPFAALPDDLLVHAWPRWPATPEGPAVASAYLVGVETPAAAQLGLIGTARGDFTIGLMASAAPRNHERLGAATVLIVELGLPDGKAYVGLALGPEQQRLLDAVVPAGDPALPFAGPVEQRILGANAPDGFGGVLWDTPADGGGVTVRARVTLYDRAIGFDVGFAVTPEGLVVSADGAAATLGPLTGISVRSAEGETIFAGGTAPDDGPASRLAFRGDAGRAAVERLRAGGDAVLTLHFGGAAGGRRRSPSLCRGAGTRSPPRRRTVTPTAADFSPPRRLAAGRGGSERSVSRRR